MEVHIDSYADALLGTGGYLATVADAEVRKSGIAGRGLFATKPRRSGEVLALLDGQVVAWAGLPLLVEALEWNALSPELLLVRPLRTSYGLINHSPTPNVGIDADGRTMRTVREVAAGEEFSMDYFAQPVSEAYLRSDEAKRLRGEG